MVYTATTTAGLVLTTAGTEAMKAEAPPAHLRLPFPADTDAGFSKR